MKDLLFLNDYVHNNRLLRPFESILKMYGIPAYNETNPTPFVGISYLLLSSHVRDLGQGLVIFWPVCY